MPAALPRDRAFHARAAALFALVAVSLWACSPAPPSRSDAEIVVAEVDGAPVVLKDVKNEILSMRGYTLSLEARGPSRGEVTEAVRRAIERTVVLREGRRRGVTLPAGALEARARDRCDGGRDGPHALRRREERLSDR